MTRRIALILLVLVVAACAPAPGRPTPVPTVSPTAQVEQSPWWREAVFYEVFVRSFYDSNGDGIGDFNGITEKLDYLNDGDPATKNDLGITGIWLMPINPSPSYHGYDVTNYYAVNPQYGSMADFKRLLGEAHKRGIHVIFDLVLNHTSSRHPFFQDALRGPSSKYYNWYIWSDTSAGNTWHQVAGDPPRYYYGLFCDCMPDLNYANPEVTAQMENVVRFWLEDVGVDGFRVDAAKHLFEEGSKTENVPETHAWYKANFYPVYKAINPQAYSVGEVYGAGATMVRSYTGDQLDQVFNFEMASGFVNSAAGGSNTGVNSAMKFALADMPGFDFATFLTNHDQNRVMSVLNGNADRAKVAASLLLTSPGTPFIYYGEEIGMQGKKPDEDIRLPMQWSAAENAGFTTGQPWRKPDAAFAQVNVASEANDPGSLLSHYRELLALREAHPALRSNGLWLVETGNPALYASLRVQNGDMILVLVNLGKLPVADYSLALTKSPLSPGKYTARTLMGPGGPATLEVDANGGFKTSGIIPAFAPYATYILELGK